MSPRSCAWRTSARALPSISSVTPVARYSNVCVRVRLARSASSLGDRETARRLATRSPGRSAKRAASSSTRLMPREVATWASTASLGPGARTASANTSWRARRDDRAGFRASRVLRPSWASTRIASCFFPAGPSGMRGARRRASTSRWGRPTNRSRSSRSVRSHG